MLTSILKCSFVIQGLRWVAPEGGDRRLVCPAKVVQDAQSRQRVRIARSRPCCRLKEAHLQIRMNECLLHL